VIYTTTFSESGPDSSAPTSPVSKSVPVPVASLALLAAKPNQSVMPTPTSAAEPTKTEPGGANAAILRVKLRIAEHEFAQAEGLYKRGEVSDAGLEIARCALEMAQAEARGDRAEILRAKLRIAEQEFTQAEALCVRGDISKAELKTAKAIFEVKQAEARGDKAAVGRAKLRIAEQELAQAEVMYQRRVISKAGLETARLTLELAQAQAAASEQGKSLNSSPSTRISKAGGTTTRRSTSRYGYSSYSEGPSGVAAETADSNGYNAVAKSDSGMKQSENEIRSFALKHADARKLAQLLSPLMKTLSLRTVDDTRNQLIVIGNHRDIEKLTSLLEELDTPGALGAMSRESHENLTTVFELRHAECQYVHSLLSQLLSNKDNIKIVAHEPTNRIIVSAEPSDHKQIEDLVRIIDRSKGRTTSRQSSTKPGLKKPGSAARAAPTTIHPRAVATKAEPGKAEQPVETDGKQPQEPDVVSAVRRNENRAWRRQMILQQISGLQSELLKQEARRRQLENDVSALEQSPHTGMSLQETLKMHQDYVNNDPMIKAMADRIAQVEMDLLVARQGLSPQHPDVTTKATLLTHLNQRLKVLKQEVKEDADDLIAKEAAKTRDQQLSVLHVQLEQSRAHEKRLQERLVLEKAKLAESDQQKAISDTQASDISWYFDQETRGWEPRSRTGSGVSE